jgi:hypothetical protein
MKNEGGGMGKETVIELLPGTVAIEVYFKFDHVVFL